MKLAIVTPYFPPMVGGIETYLFELVNELSKDNSVCVFTCGRGTTETYRDYTVKRLKALDVRNLPLNLGIPYPVPPTLMFELAKDNFDLIHAHGHAFVTSFFAAAVARLTHKPFVLTIHDIGIAYHNYRVIRGIRPIVDSTIVNFIIKQASAVIALNNATSNYIKKFKPKRIEMIPQGIDLSKFNPKENDGDGSCLLYTSDACLLYTSPSPRDRS